MLVDKKLYPVGSICVLNIDEKYSFDDFVIWIGDINKCNWTSCIQKHNGTIVMIVSWLLTKPKTNGYHVIVACDDGLFVLRSRPMLIWLQDLKLVV